MDEIQWQIGLSSKDWSVLLAEKDRNRKWKRMRWNTVVQIAKEYKRQIDDGDISAMDFAEVDLIAPNFFGKKWIDRIRSLCEIDQT